MSVIYIKYNTNTNTNLFLLWIKHYLFMKIPFEIICEDDNFISIYPEYVKYLNSNINDTTNNGHLILTEYDFIVGYHKNENDDMVLSNNIDTDFLEKSILIGKVFSVHVKNATKYTTFEIPDFILYKHLDHTNYTIDGININGGQEISNNIVCFNMNISKVSYEKEYYYTDFFNGHRTCGYNIYKKIAYNIFVNKEYKYAIIWHLKCACSTINKYIYKYNINSTEDKYRHDLSKQYQKFRYNMYLQNFEIISFVRNPYHRFISCYINKHINKEDVNYLNETSYNDYLKYCNDIDSLYNFINYIKNDKYIDEHSSPISHYYYNIYKLKPTIYKIENNLNQTINDFLTKKHNKTLCDDLFFMNISKNVNINETNTYKNYDFKFFNYNDWTEFIKKYNTIPNYNDILDDQLIELINIVYKEDLNNFNYTLQKSTSCHLLLYNSKCKNIPEDFEAKTYIEINEDLQKLSELAAIEHYKNTGIYENRKYKYENIPEDFEAKIYIEINEDLKNFTEKEAKNHYDESGFYENRKYNYENIPEDFEAKIYIEINEDLKNFTEKEAKNHYDEIGFYENRKYKL